MNETPAPQLYRRRKYANPPITDAICEFRFDPSSPPWNPAIPGLVYERLRDEYPATPRQAVQSGIEVQAQPNIPSLVFRQPVPSVEFVDQAEHFTVSLGPGVLTVRGKAPYEGWEQFHARITRAVGAYEAVTADAHVHRVGLRYVNKILLPTPQGTIKLTDYFNAPPVTPDDFPEQLVGIVARWESHYADSEHRDVRLLYTFATTPSGSDDVAAFVLDLDVIEFWEEQPPPLADTLDELTDLKRRETDAFEAAITDRARELFDAS